MLVLAVLLVASHKLKGVFRVNSIESASIDESCDLRKDVCTSILPKGGKVHFSITPKDIKTSSSLSFQVKVEGVETSSVEVDLIGLNMEMGFNRPKLNKETSNIFKGPAILPICTENIMNWEANVLLQTERGLITAPFRFHTFK